MGVNIYNQTKSLYYYIETDVINLNIINSYHINIINIVPYNVN
jgi:hypothetical protein